MKFRFLKFINVYFLLTCIVLCFPQNLCSQVVRYDTQISIDKRGKKTTRKNIVIQVNDKDENWLSHVEISHDPKQKLTFNYGKIIDLSGHELRKLRKKELKTRSDLSHQTFYQDNLITEFDLYWNEYPYRIEYSYEVEESEYMHVAFWQPVLYYKIPTLHSSLAISFPEDMEIRKIQSNDLILKERKIDKTKTYYWEASEIRLPNPEIFSPHYSELIPFVTVTSQNFKYGVDGRLDSWTSLGSWFEELNKESNDLPYHEIRNINKMIDGIDNQEDIVKRIYHFLQDNTKYINVDMDVGGLKSYPASYVFQNKYGDCKALTTYMKSMLDGVGIESYYTLIGAGQINRHVNPDFPSQQFNHVILVVPVDNDTLWLENTSNSVPFNYLGTFTQDRLALSINANESKLIKTPSLVLSDVLDQRNYDFSKVEENNWKVTADLNLRGESFENFRYTLNNLGESDQEKQAVQHVELTEFDLDKWELEEFHRDSCSVKLKLEGSCVNFVRKIGAWEVISPLRISLPRLEDPEDRLTDVCINFPINKLDNSIYRIQNIDKLEMTKPKDVEISSKYGRYFATYQNSNSLIEVKEGFTLYANENIPLVDYPAFHAFIDSIIQQKKKFAILLK